MAGGVDGPQPELGGFNAVTVSEEAVGADAVPTGKGKQFSSGPLAQRFGSRGVVSVVVGQHDPADPVSAATQNGVKVIGVVGAGIDDGDLINTDEIRVGSRAGHDPGVGSDDPSNHGAESPSHAWFENFGRCLGVLTVVRTVGSPLTHDQLPDPGPP